MIFRMFGTTGKMPMMPSNTYNKLRGVEFFRASFFALNRLVNNPNKKI